MRLRDWLLLVTLLAVARGGVAEELGLKAPAGFEVSLFAGDDLAHDIFSLTLDKRGRVVVAGRDYVKILHDEDRDGRAERATLFAKVPQSGAHGMVFDGDDLICTGDDSVLRLRDTNGDGQADGEPVRLAKLRHPEHGANGIVQGPDGWLYIICGNDSGLGTEHVTTSMSPVRQPQSGGVVRITPDGAKSEVVAHGFRNPYDLDFGPQGHLFTYDSDGERDHHLPWYVPTRIFDIAAGMHHGWVMQGWTRSWSRPASFCDNVPPVALVGRGSPTGVTVYRHTAFPVAYRNNLFALCWTLGRVYRFQLEEQGDTFVSKPEVFLETTGETGFAPVDIAVGREGEMYVAIGGRRTRGSVFKVVYREPSMDGNGLRDDLMNVLQAPQPLAAWSRTEWVPLAKKLGRTEFVKAVASERPVADRVRAVEVLTELFDGFDANEAAALPKELDARVAARVAWSLGRTHPNDVGAKLLAPYAARPEPHVQRAAWSALLELPSDTVAPLTPASDRVTTFIRALALAKRDIPTDELEVLAAGGKLDLTHFPAGVKRLRTALANRAALDERGALAAIRLLQLTLGDINVKPQPQEFRTGCSATCDPEERRRATAVHHAELAASFPSGLAEVDRELARLLAMLEVEDVALTERIAAKCSAESSPQDDLHFLIAASCLPGRRSATTTALAAAALVQLPAKMEAREQYPSRNWPARVEELVARLIEVDPQLPAALLADERLKSPSHALYAKKFPREAKVAAARKLIAAALAAGPEEPRWTPTLLELADTLPSAEALPFLREAADDFALRDQALLRLTKDPKLDDRPRFVRGLDSIQSDIVAACAGALAKFDPPLTDEEQVRALSALKQSCLSPDARDARQSLTALLAKQTGQTFAVEERKGADLAAGYQPVFAWFASARPAVAAKLREFSGGDAAQWKERLEKIDWEAGDPLRGKTVFEKRSCVRCHSGTGPLGPDLAGAATRFARLDLFAAIVDPSKDVAPTYQTTQVVTRGGRSYHGLIVYESPDGTLLQTGPDVTVRVAGDEVISMRKSKVSLMPTGLLNGAADGELADLDAYLRTLKAAK